MKELRRMFVKIGALREEPDCFELMAHYDCHKNRLAREGDHEPVIVLTPGEFEERVREAWETAQEMDRPESFSHHFNSWFKERYGR